MTSSFIEIWLLDWILDHTVKLNTLKMYNSKLSTVKNIDPKYVLHVVTSEWTGQIPVKLLFN